MTTPTLYTYFKDQVLKNPDAYCLRPEVELEPAAAPIVAPALDKQLVRYSAAASVSAASNFTVLSSAWTSFTTWLLSAVPAKRVTQKQTSMQATLAKHAAALDAQALTRQQVWERACQLANYLINVHNIKKGDVVAFAYEHSIEAVITILAINRAHAVFMPLNKRNRVELQEAFNSEDAKLILTDSPLLGLDDCTQVNIVQQAAEISQQATSEPSSPEALQPGEDAYIAATSGSTGEKPKFLRLSHDGFKYWAQEKPKHYSRLDENSRYAVISPFFYDAGHVSVLLAGIFGCQLVIPKRETLVNPASMKRFLLTNKISAGLFIPSVWNSLKLTPALGELVRNGFTHIESTGEAFDARLFEQLKAVFSDDSFDLNRLKTIPLLNDLKRYALAYRNWLIPSKRIRHYDESQLRLIQQFIRDEISAEALAKSFDLNVLRALLPPEELAYIFVELENLYGPTEGVYGFSVKRPHPSEVVAGKVPIGIPTTAGTKMVIARDRGDGTWIPVESGAQGIGIIISGHMTKGYRDPQASKKAFVQVIDPETGEVVRGFNTGDELTYDPERRLMFCNGRVSLTMVKVANGVKVDVHGLEKCLREREDILDVAVVMPDESRRSSNPVLAVYYQLKPGYPALEMTDLKRFLSAQGYPYHHYIAHTQSIDMSKFTLPNGKKNRRALGMLSIAYKSERYIKPRNAVEAAIQDAWHAVLSEHVEQHGPISTDATFQRIGGSSHLFMQLMTELSLRFDQNFLPTKAPAKLIDGKIPVGNRKFNDKDFQDVELTISNMAVIMLNEQILANVSRKTGLPTFVTLVPAKADLHTLRSGRDPVFYIPGITGKLANDEFRMLEEYHAKTERPIVVLEDPLFTSAVEVLSVKQRASLYIEVIKMVRPDVAPTIAGFSAGVYTAVEMVHQLEKEGREVGRPALIDEIAPMPDQFMVASKDVGNLAHADKIIKLANKLLAITMPGTSLPRTVQERLRHKPVHEQIVIVCSELKRFLDSTLIDVVQNHLTSIANYQGQVPVISAEPYIYASEENRSTLDELLPKGKKDTLDSLGWSVYQKSFQVSVVAGGFKGTTHLSLFNNDKFKEVLFDNLSASKGYVQAGSPTITAGTDLELQSKLKEAYQENLSMMAVLEGYRRELEKARKEARKGAEDYQQNLSDIVRRTMLEVLQSSAHEPTLAAEAHNGGTLHAYGQLRQAVRDAHRPNVDSPPGELVPRRLSSGNALTARPQ